MKISVYDFDNTLVSSNSVYGFVKFSLEVRCASKIGYVLSIILLHIKIWFGVNLFGSSKSEVLVKELKGFNKNWLKENGVSFAKTRLIYNKQIVEQLRDDVNNGFHIIIISGGIDDVLLPSANDLGVTEVICSSLNFAGCLCLGEFERDVRGKKSEEVDRLVSKYKIISLSDSKFTSDNLEDIPCATRFGKIVGVAKGPVAAQVWSRVTDNIKVVGGGVELGWKHLFLPGYYYIFVRANWLELVLHRIIYSLILCVYCAENANPLVLFISWLNFILLYEVGYLDNDYNAAKNEDFPSLRLGDNQKWHYVRIFVGVRIFLFLISAIALSRVAGLHSSLLVSGLSLINLLIYLFHNRLKQKNRLITYPVLKASHLYIPLITTSCYSVLVISLLAFYLPQTITGYARKIGVLDAGDLTRVNGNILFVQLVLVCLLWLYNSAIAVGLFGVAVYIVAVWAVFYLKEISRGKFRQR
jgi:phosphoserine phosphatase